MKRKIKPLNPNQKSINEKVQTINKRISMS